MPLQFERSEYSARREAAQERMRVAGLAGMLLFRQESMYYLTGYDSTGFLTFQCLLLTADGELVLLTRSPDLRQSKYTSVIEDVRIWRDRADFNPAFDLRDILEEKGLRNAKLGIELEAFGLTAARGKWVEEAMQGFCLLQDASALVSELRLVKSNAELAYVEKAGALADEALDVAKATARPGVFEGELYAQMHGTIFRGGGFYPASRFAIGSGDKALIVRTTCEMGTIGEDDQLQLEFAAAYRHYHAGLMRTLLTGKVRDEHRDMHKASVDAMAACKEACRPGGMAGDIFDAHARVYDAAGYKEHRLNACGYSLGATYSPSWMDWPMLHTGQPVELKPNMVFLLLMILLDSEKGLAMSHGETVVVTDIGCRTLSNADNDLIVL
ncbi:MAG: Xaa-Pro peptidase family protein [Pseudomonadota bacterium]